MNYYLDPALAPIWLPVLERVIPRERWILEVPMTWAPTDVVLLPMTALGRLTEVPMGKVFLLEPTLKGPALAQVLEALLPNPRALQELDEDALEAGWRTLLEGWDSLEDLERLKRFSYQLWRTKRRAADSRWLELSQLCWMFEFRRVILPESGEVPLFVGLGYRSWYEFSQEFLGMAPAVSSALKHAWQNFHVQLGWSENQMLAVGKSKLMLANGIVESLLQAPRDDGKLQEVVDALTTDSFAELNDRFRSARGGGHVISFELEPVNDPAMVKKWLNAPILPDLWHVKVWHDGAPFEDGIAIIIHPSIDAESASAIKEKLAKLLHWIPRERKGG